MTTTSFERLDVRMERRGVVLTPNGDASEAEGVLNPACARTHAGDLLLYPRCVAEGNISRVGIMRVRENAGGFSIGRDGFALQPDAPYELRPQPGYGCEDPRVTYVGAIGKYVMAYTAFGPQGPRIAIALSNDGLSWERLGLLRFEHPGMNRDDDKDAAFFPEPVLSPNGVESLAFYHRPMLHLSAVDGRAATLMIERMPFEDRESIRIGYIPLAGVRDDITKLLEVGESVQVLSPDDRWGSIKLGAGTPPVLIDEGWMSVFHAVDAVALDGGRPGFQYSAGIVVHDRHEPHRVIYRSPQPVLRPETAEERTGIVDNVVFPTGIDPRPDLGARTFDIYYGMADYAVGAVRMTLI